MPKLLLCILVGALTLAAQTLNVSGRVMDSNGKPIEGATVNLQLAGARNTTQVPTNAQGAFAIENLPAGRYSFFITKPGYVTYFQSSLTDSRTGAEIRLALASVISGRALDVDGNPIPKAPITAYRYSFIRGARSLNPAGYTIQTDASGAYAFPNLTAGRYYLRVEAMPPGVTTYYPSTLDPGAAAAVDVHTGGTRSGVDIRQLKVPVFHVRGKVVTEGGEPAPNTSLRILAEQAIETQTPALPPSMIADGSFEFKDLLPGRYVIRAVPNGNVRVDGNFVPAKNGGRANVTITRDNIDDFRLTVREGGYSVSGKVKTEDDSALPIPPPPAVQAPPGVIALTGLRVRLIDAEQTYTPGDLSGAAAPEGGAFRIETIVPGKYYVTVSPLPPNVYVKSVQYGGQDRTRAPIDLMYGGGDTLEIVLGTKAGTVNASVRDAKGNPVPRVQVALWPDKADPGSQTASIRMVVADDMGVARFTGLRPEKYRVAAFAEAEQGFVRSPDFLDKFRGRAAELEVGDGASLERTLEPVSREDAAAVIRNLP